MTTVEISSLIICLMKFQVCRKKRCKIWLNILVEIIILCRVYKGHPAAQILKTISLRSEVAVDQADPPWSQGCRLPGRCCLPSARGGGAGSSTVQNDEALGSLTAAAATDGSGADPESRSDAEGMPAASPTHSAEGQTSPSPSPSLPTLPSYTSARWDPQAETIH